MTTSSADESGNDLTSAISSSFMTKNVEFDAPGDVVAALKERWTTVVAPLFRKDTFSWWNRIVSLHSEPDRAYHRLMHLQEMMGFVDLVRQSSNQIVILAVFFHDAIYDAKSATNEEDSAKLFQEFCRDTQCKNEELEARVVQYILLTKSHKIPQDDDDPNLALFLDIDMAVLGKEEHAYLHYAGLIRQEYKFVDRSVYCEKRAEILETFLEESHIFVSKPMREALEQRARGNLRKEIELLTSGMIPGEAQT